MPSKNSNILNKLNAKCINSYMNVELLGKPTGSSEISAVEIVVIVIKIDLALRNV